MLEEDSAESKSNKSKLFDAITEGKSSWPLDPTKQHQRT